MPFRPQDLHDFDTAREIRIETHGDKDLVHSTIIWIVVGVTLLADSSINIAVKPWVAVADYVPAAGELYQAIVDRFRERDVQIPFPQREVRMLDSRVGG